MFNAKEEPVRFDKRTAFRAVLIGTAALSITACASRRPPADPLAGQTGAEAAGPTGPSTAPSGSVGSTNMAPVPGSVQDFVVNVGERVYFDTDEYVIRSDAQPVLRAQAAWLSRYPNVRVIIEGSADERGTREYNLALGARRAQAVRDFLIAQGVSAARIETISYGKERPLDPGTGDEAWARNRNARTAVSSGALGGPTS
jgi:peptidoglycan-associated lipoprotein